MKKIIPFLFAILFCWQMPHFLSLAWMYRKDYARANYKILTVFDATGARTGKQIIIFLFALIPVTMMTSFIGMTGKTYFITALCLNGAFVFFGLMMMRSCGTHTVEAHAKLTSSARRLFFASPARVQNDA